MIYTADWHLRDDVPRCRVQTESGWFDTQEYMVNHIVDVANKDDGELFIAGDIFHRPLVSSGLVSMLQYALGRLKGHAYIMAGNHDLRHRDTDDRDTSYQVLASSASHEGKLRLIRDWFSEVPYGSWEPVGNGLLVGVHALCLQNQDPRGKFTSFITPEQLSSKFPKAKLIIVGDNHQSFIEGNVINPGCILTQSVNEDNHIHMVYRVGDDGIITPVRLPSDLTEIVYDRYTQTRDVIVRNLAAFVEVVEDSDIGTLDFSQSLLEGMINLSKDAEKILRELMEEL